MVQKEITCLKREKGGYHHMHKQEQAIFRFLEMKNKIVKIKYVRSR